MRNSNIYICQSLPYCVVCIVKQMRQKKPKMTKKRVGTHTMHTNKHTNITIYLLTVAFQSCFSQTWINLERAVHKQKCYKKPKLIFFRDATKIYIEFSYREFLI